jgi:hypothetical protein
MEPDASVIRHIFVISSGSDSITGLRGLSEASLPASVEVLL